MKINAYAKINLALEVMDIENGYHKVNNLMVPIALHDEIEMKVSDSIQIEDDPFPMDNIMRKAIELFFLKTNISGGVYIKIKKNIPSQAGLGGGSSDAAATLLGLNMLYETNLSDDELISLSSSLGSDVGFFIKNKVALCTGRGEIVNTLDIKMPKLNVLLIKPNVGLSTKEIYKNYEYLGEPKEDKINGIINALKNKQIDELKRNIFNDLKRVSLDVSKELRELYNEIKELGIDVFVSGSGPTMYVVDPTMEEILKIKDVAKRDTYIFNTNTF